MLCVQSKVVFTKHHTHSNITKQQPTKKTKCRFKMTTELPGTESHILYLDGERMTVKSMLENGSKKISLLKIDCSMVYGHMTGLNASHSNNSDSLENNNHNMFSDNMMSSLNPPDISVIYQFELPRVKKDYWGFQIHPKHTDTIVMFCWCLLFACFSLFFSVFEKIQWRISKGEIFFCFFFILRLVF